MEKDRLKELLRQFKGRRILVIGDCMLDEYLWGRVNRISPEAPVMVVDQVDKTYAAGGASNVAVNIVAMDGAASILSVVGDDSSGARLRQELERQGVRHNGVVVDTGRPTTVKTRIFAQDRQVMRVDREERAGLSAAASEQLIERAKAEIVTAEAILFSDYSKGVLTEQVVAEIMALARAAGKPAFANPKPASIRFYQGIDLVTVNQTEAEQVTGVACSAMEVLDEAGNRLLRSCAARSAVITLGGRGLALFEAGKPWRHLPVVPLEVYDPCGCGDSAIAAAALARTAGGDWVEAATLANLAGNAKVRKLGVVPVTRKEIERVWTLGSANGNGNGNGAR